MISSIKHHTLTGRKLLIVKTEEPQPVLAVDFLGAGAGMDVLLSSDGKFVAELVGTPATPIRWSIIGIVNTLEK